MDRGILIAVEGIDGAGKTTQVRLLDAALAAAGEPVVVSKEPTNGVWGRKLRDSASRGRLPLGEELEAFLNDRTEHVNTLIAPSLEAGKIVILDRYFYSTIAYQGARGEDPEQLRILMETRFPVPDAVYLIDTEPAVSLARIADSRGDIPNEFERLEGLVRARTIFNAIGSQNIVRVDGHQPAERIHALIVDHLTMNALRAARCAKSYGCHDEFHCSARITGTCRWFTLASQLRSKIAV